jgi:hypothetical protein
MSKLPIWILLLLKELKILLISQKWPFWSEIDKSLLTKTALEAKAANFF